VSGTSDRPYAPGTELTRGDGSRLRVGESLNKGAEGVIYEALGEPDVAFKQFTSPKLLREPELQSRIATMLAAPPPGWREQSSEHVLLTWPLDVVGDGNRFVGYVMPRIDTDHAVEVHVLSNASDRLKPGPKTPQWVSGFTWKYLVQVAANLALATDVLHASGCVFGDFNDRNILVSDHALVTLIDCDSMQVPRPGGGAYLCRVGRSEFEAPELSNMDLAKTPRAPTSDLFPLAVHIHQLLFDGLHPFDGVWHGRGEKPKRHVLARRGLYVYGKDHLLRPHNSCMGFDLVPKQCQSLFIRAFIEGARDPVRRPTGAEWHTTLVAMQAHLRTCERNREHVYSDHLRTCPWCEQDQRVQAAEQRRLRPVAVGAGRVVPPPPRVAARPSAATAAPGIRRFNRPVVWISGLVVLVAVALALSSKGGAGPSSTANGTLSPQTESSPPVPAAPARPSSSPRRSGQRAHAPRAHNAAGVERGRRSQAAIHSTAAGKPSRRASQSPRRPVSSSTGGLSGSTAPTQAPTHSSSSGLSGGAEREASTQKSAPPSGGGGLSGSAGGEGGGSGLSGSASK
jgi:hypothetical protein